MNNIYYTNFMYAVSKDIGAYTDDIKFVYEFQDRFLAIVKISTNECVIKTFMKEIGDNKGYFLDVNLFNGSYESCKDYMQEILKDYLLDKISGWETDSLVSYIGNFFDNMTIDTMASEIEKQGYDIETINK